MNTIYSIKEGRFRNLVTLLRSLFNLRDDTDESGTVDSIVKNVDFRSANALTLVFAIFTASIGLNLNSAAVIIGAMLISPMMGPIVGTGLALGINDYDLLRRALRNLGIAVGISIFTSTIYFLVSPLTDAHSEILARTQPTFYDVLIALLGGATGIVASSRSEKGNSIAGVAIATALMPPLCTAGYGLAVGNFQYFLGALYLFTINSVFIALSTFVFVRYLKFKKVKVINKHAESRVNRMVTVIAVTVTLPSLVMAWLLLRESTLISRSQLFIKEQVSFPGTFIVGKDIEYRFRKSTIKLSLLGNVLSDPQVAGLKDKMRFYDLEDTALEILQYTPDQHREKMERGRDVSAGLQVKLVELQQELDRVNQRSDLEKALNEELRVLVKSLNQIIILEGGGVVIQWLKRPPKLDMKRVEEFVRLRLKQADLSLSHTVKI